MISRLGFAFALGLAILNYNEAKPLQNLDEDFVDVLERVLVEQKLSNQLDLKVCSLYQCWLLEVLVRFATALTIG